MAGVQIDGVNNKIDFDDDADTSISSASDDTLVVEVGGNTLATVTATSVTINDGVTITTADNTDTLTLVSTDTDSSYGPNIEMSRPVTGATSDLLGRIDFSGQDAAGNTHNYFSIEAIIDDATSGSEYGRMLMRTEVAGATKNMIDMNGSEIVFNEDSVDYDFRVESNGDSHALFVNAEYDHHVAIGSTMTSFGVGDTLDIGGYGSMFKLDANNAIYNSANLYYDGSTWDKQTSNAYGSIIVQHTGNALPFQIYIIDNQSGGAGTNVNSALTERFRMATDGTLTATDTSIGSISDQRLKENIQDYTYDINKFKQFKTRTFDWKHPEAHTGEVTTGFVAQEVESVDSDWVYETIWDDVHKGAKWDEEKALCNNEPKKAAKLGKKDAMYISIIQQLITRIEALEDA